MAGAKDLIILDGGMGRELERMGAPLRQPEWSALAVMESPDSVYQAHRNFIDAGAQIITTNAYALVPYHIGEERFAQNGRALIKLSAELARRAVDESGHSDIKVAGSIPPLFGSYMPELYDPQKADAILRPLVEEQAPYVDFWLAETISSIEEAIHVLSLIRQYSDKPLWLAFSIAGEADGRKVGTLRSGEVIDKAIASVMTGDVKPQAILYNCCQPEEIVPALKVTAKTLKKLKADDIQYGGYANSFVKVKKRRLPSNQGVNKLREEMTPKRYLAFAKAWRKQGASIIGGCCGIGPEHIAALKNGLK